jgi:aminoglycoside 6'-N-acetyltransferase I
MSGTREIVIRRLSRGEFAEWGRMRVALWPDSAADDLAQTFETLAVFVADRGGGRLGGFVEVGARSFAEGCERSPVAYIEGWFVDSDLRRRGVGGALLRAAEDWARQAGYADIGSDALIDNEGSIAAHKALGYREMERIVCFAKRL